MRCNNLVPFGLNVKLTKLGLAIYVFSISFLVP